MLISSLKMLISLLVPCCLNHLQGQSSIHQVIVITTILGVFNSYKLTGVLNSFLFFINTGGLMFKDGGSNLQHATALSFLVLVYSRYLEESKREVSCTCSLKADKNRFIQLAKSQV